MATAKTLIERFGFTDGDRVSHKHDEMQIWAYHNFRTIVKSTFPLLDLDDNVALDVKLEYPISAGKTSFIVGFIDLYCRKLSIGMEVKTEIRSAGELIRQIQFYKRFVTGSWIVVSPDTWCEQVLKEQGIFFYQYQGGKDCGQLFLFPDSCEIKKK